MKRKKLTFIASLACGILCAACVMLFMDGVRNEAEAERAETLARYGGEQLEVCVATRDIAAGQGISSSDVELRLWVADLLPADAARSLDEVVGKAPTTPIMEGEVVVLKRFQGSNEALEVPAGKAALSVPVKDVQAVGGSLVAGSSADLYASSGTSTTLLARDVLVLTTSAAGSEGASAELSWVTLAVEPKAVQEIIDASQRLELYFALPGAEAPASDLESGVSSAVADAETPVSGESGVSSDVTSASSGDSANDEGGAQ